MHFVSRFISDFEEIIRQRDLTSGRCKSVCTESDEKVTNQWHEELDEIRFSKIKFTVTHCWTQRRAPGNGENISDDTYPIALQDIDESVHDFTIRPLVGRFYGLCEYMVLSAIGNADISSEDNLKLLIGSINVALQNTQCQLPVFVQMHIRKLNIYQGTMVCKDIRSSFDMVYMNEFPSTFCYLSYLLELFKRKVCGNNECPVPVNVTARFTRVLKKWPGDTLFQHHPIDPEDPPKDISSVIDFVAYRDPIVDLRLFTSWNTLSEELVSDSQFHSDFDPSQAPICSVRVTFDDPSQLSSSLSETLNGFYSLSLGSNRNKQILGGLIQEIEESEAENEVRQALDRLSNQNTLSLNLPQIKIPKRSFIIPQNIVSSLLSYIFEEQSISGLKIDFRPYKSAQFDSLSWRIVHVLTFVYSSYKDLSTLAIFWKEIINELRRFWESSIPLPG